MKVLHTSTTIVSQFALADDDGNVVKALPNFQQTTKIFSDTELTAMTNAVKAYRTKLQTEAATEPTPA